MLSNYKNMEKIVLNQKLKNYYRMEIYSVKMDKRIFIN